MATIELTPERAKIITESTAEWLLWGLSTDPTDFDAAEDAIARLYATVDRKRLYFVRLDSPLAAELYINLLTNTWLAMADCLDLRQMRRQLRDELALQLTDQLGDQLGGQLGDQLGDQLWGQLGDQLWGQLGDQLGDRLWDQLGDQLWGQLWGHPLKYTGTWFWGSQDAHTWGFYDAGRRLGAKYPDAINVALDAHCDIVRNCGWIYPFADFCIITGRPSVINRDDRNRLHSTSGPAIAYRDGWSIYAHHGIRCAREIIENPETITVQSIKDCANAELRRVMTERYCFGQEIAGDAAFIRDAGGTILDHEDGIGTLYRLDVEDDDPICAVRVVNGSREPDGSFKIYWLPVHPDCCPLLADGTLGSPQKVSARAAVASTYGLTAAQYQDVVRT